MRADIIVSYIYSQLYIYIATHLNLLQLAIAHAVSYSFMQNKVSVIVRQPSNTNKVEMSGDIEMNVLVDGAAKDQNRDQTDPSSTVTAQVTNKINVDSQGADELIKNTEATDEARDKIKCPYCEGDHKNVKECHKCILQYRKLLAVKKLEPSKIITKFHLVLLAFYISTIHQIDSAAVTITLQDITGDKYFSSDQLNAFGNSSELVVLSVSNAVIWNCQVNNSHWFESIYQTILGCFIALYVFISLENIGLLVIKLKILDICKMLPSIVGGLTLSAGVLMLILSHNVTPIVCKDGFSEINYDSTTQKVDFQFQQSTIYYQKGCIISAIVLIIVWKVWRGVTITIYEIKADRGLTFIISGILCIRSFLRCNID